MKENLENNLNITISFDNKYNGNKKDRIRYKTSNFSLVFIGGLIIFCAGIYLMFFHFRPRPIGIQKYEAIFIFVLGIVLIIASPFAFIFSKMNAKFDGEIMFNIKKDESNPDYQLNVTGYKKEKLCKETCIINSIEAKKNFYEINTRKGKNYIIPFSQISEDNKNKLSEIAALLKEHNTIKN